MRRSSWLTVSVAAAVLLVSWDLRAADKGTARIDGEPVWQEIGESAGGAVPVRSFENGAVLGYLQPGTRVLAFGTTDQWITLAYKGQIGFIPAAAARELYPSPPVNKPWRSFGETLEDKVSRLQREQDENRKNKVPLYRSTPPPAQPGGGAPTGPGLDPFGASRARGSGYI
jgi:hypothetical protein